MNSETDFQRDIPAENIRNVGVLTEFFESGFLQLLLDYAEPHEPHYTDVELACPLEVLSYSAPPLPSEMTRYWKHSGTNYQFNLTTALSQKQSICPADGLIISVCEEDKLQSIPETLQNISAEKPIPCMIFLDYQRITSEESPDRLSEMVKILSDSGYTALPLQLPIMKTDKGFCGCVDVIEQKAFLINGLYGEEITEIPIPEELAAEALSAYENIISAVEQNSPEIMQSYLRQIPIAPQKLKEALRKEVIAGHTLPIFCGTAPYYKAISISGLSRGRVDKKNGQAFLDAIADYLPSPLDVPAAQGINPHTGEPEIRNCKDGEPFCALAFGRESKTIAIKILSGIAVSGATAYNPQTKTKIQIKDLHKDISGKKEIKVAFCGEMALIEDAEFQINSGDTICSPEFPFAFPVSEKDYTMALRAKIQDAKAEKQILRQLTLGDNKFTVYKNPENGNVLFASSGDCISNIIRIITGELQISVIPETFCKETITQSVTFDTRSAALDCAPCVLQLTPHKCPAGIKIENRTNNSIPAKLIDQIKAGIMEASHCGILAGFPMTDIKVEILEAVQTSSVVSLKMFQKAGYQGMREAVRQACPILLSPRQKIKIISQTEDPGLILNLIARHDGQIIDIHMPEEKENLLIVRADMPVEELIPGTPFVSELRNCSRARGSYTIETTYFTPVSKQAEEKIIKNAQPFL